MSRRALRGDWHRVVAAREKRLAQVTESTMGQFLAEARRLVLGGQPTLAAAADDVPPDLDRWPADDVWANLVRGNILPVIGAMFGEAFRAFQLAAHLSDRAWRLNYLETVFDRLVIWPKNAFTEVRYELLEAMEQGEDLRAQRARLGRVLNIDALSRTLQARIGEIERELEDGDPDPAQRRALRAERSELYGRKDREDKRWAYYADRIARTEVMGALNGGTFAAAEAYTDETGDLLQKEWIATSDERVRATHWAADQQVRPLAEPFEVGGFDLMYPGQAGGPAHEVINCRCTTGITDAEGDGVPTLATPEEEERDMPRPVRAATTAAGGEGQLPVGWTGVLAPMGTSSGDGRVLAAMDVVRTRTLPLVFLSQESLSMGHDGATITGDIQAVWVEGGMIYGAGRWDLGSEEGQESARLLATGFARWVSVDLDDHTVEEVFFRDGEKVDPPTNDDWRKHEEAMWGEIPPEEDPLAGLDVKLEFTDYRLIGATFVSQPAFQEAEIQAVWSADELQTILDAHAEAIVASARIDDRTLERWPSLVAGAGPLQPQASWFTAPVLTEPTPITITDDGRIFGHLATWGTCHVGFPEECVTAPPSAMGYAQFHVGEVVCAGGERLAVGKITLGGGHADLRAGARAAAAHYDDAGTAVAVVRAAEDDFGIVLSGAILPCVTADQLAALRRSPLSGDWRMIGGSQELVAALCVNVPGFPVPRARALAAGGQTVALVAAGALRPRARTQGARSPVAYDVPAKEFARQVYLEQIALQRNGQKVAALAARIGEDYATQVRRLAERIGV